MSPASIYIPVTFNEVRLEPEIGFYRSHEEDQNTESTLTMFQIGTGGFMFEQVNSTVVYYGGRVGITLITEEFSSNNANVDDSRTNFYIGPAFGAEHMFSDNFSLGGELQLLYISIGQVEGAGSDAKENLFSTFGTLFVRWYLW
jgi:hypothetical protein